LESIPGLLKGLKIRAQVFAYTTERTTEKKEGRKAKFSPC
jgi:hypothetical protein